MTIRAIMEDARTWQTRHTDIVAAYVEHRAELKALGMDEARYGAARELLRCILVTAKHRAEVAA